MIALLMILCGKMGSILFDHSKKGIGSWCRNGTGFLEIRLMTEIYCSLFCVLPLSKESLAPLLDLTL